MNDFKKNIIEKIKKGEIDMKPKWHFVLKTILVVTGTVITALLSIYLLSFVFFALHRSGLLFAPGFGMQGLGVFITSSPWLLILLVAIFLITLYTLVKKYSFSYKRPLLYSMLGVLLFVVMGSFAAEQVKMHDRIQAFTERHNVPGAGPLYKSVVDKIPENVTHGTITDVTERGFEVETRENDSVSISITNKTRQRQGSTYKAGEEVIIFGKKNETEDIEAFGIKKVDAGFRNGPRIKGQEGQVINPLHKKRLGY